MFRDYALDSANNTVTEFARFTLIEPVPVPHRVIRNTSPIQNDRPLHACTSS